MSSQVQLVERAVGGDEIALALLLAELRPATRAYLQSRIPNALRTLLDADDVLQEAHVAIFRSVRTFRPNGAGSFERWLLAIALRKLHDAVRAQRAQRRGGGRAPVGEGADRDRSFVGLLALLAGNGTTPSGAVARVEAVDALDRAVAGLPDDYRRAVELVYLRGLPVAAAATELGRTERAVHGLCRRGLEHLRRSMGDASAYFSSSG